MDDKQMTNEQAVEMMKAKLECITREMSGTDQMCNAKKCYECGLCYVQGNMGEQKKWLRMAIEALEKQKTGHWIDVFGGCECSKCGYLEAGYSDYCPTCGAKMKGETNG